MKHIKKQNNIFAFFDVDGTVLQFNSLLHFLEYFLNNYFGQQEAEIRMSKYKNIVKDAGLDCSREKLNELYYQNFVGIKEEDLRKVSLRWFNTIIHNNDAFNRGIIKKLQYHQKNEHVVVLVSGGFFATLDALAQHLNISHVLCVSPVINEGVLTGAIDLHSQTIGNGKSQAIQRFLTTNYDVIQDQLGDVLSNCYAYGDHISDSNMLSVVGQGFVVGNNIEMITLAHQNNWKIFNEI